MMNECFADWLDVTFSPDDFPFADVELFLLGYGFEAKPTDNGYLYASPQGFRGTVKVNENRHHCRVSCSGGVLAYLRVMDALNELLGIFAGSAHRVTRLDIAYDMPLDFADWYEQFMAEHGNIAQYTLYRNALPVKHLVEYRETDGRVSGTLYFGHRTRARYTARIYDKAAEALVNRGETLPPTTRFEITVREGNAMLRDVSVPAALFWEVMARNDILKHPKTIPQRCMIDLSPSYAKREERLPATVVKRGIESDAQLAALIRVADSMPNGREYLIREITDYIRHSSTISAAS